MAVSDQRVAEFAHELNNSLAVISGHATSARSRLEAEDLDTTSLKRAVDEIARASARAAVLTRELLTETRAASRKHRGESARPA